MTIPLLRMPMFGFFGLGFLFFCTIVAIAVWLALRSGPQGQTKLGGFAGCAIALALLVIAGMGALGCTVIACLNTPNELVRHGPIKGFEFRWEDEPGSENGDLDVPAPGPTDEKHAARLRIELHGTEPGEVTRWLRDNTDVDVPYTVSTGVGDDGTVVHLDISLEIPRREVRRIRRDLERAFPNLRIPDGVRIELKGEDD